jgi:hypothetical protein
MATMRCELTAGHTSPVSVFVDGVSYQVTFITPFNLPRTVLVPRPIGMALVTAGLARDRGAVVHDGPWPAVTPTWSWNPQARGAPSTPAELAAVAVSGAKE